MQKLALALSLLLFAACSSPAPSTTGIDWNRADEHWSVHVVTLDEDGDERVTRVWLAVEGSDGTIRTGDSRWWGNLLRDPACRLRIDGVDYPLRAQPVSEAADKIRIDEAFAAKYGWYESLMFPQERGETHENYARLVAE